MDMYSKCGSMEEAWRVFNRMPSRTVVTWNAILGGCARNGHDKEALKYFEQMCDGVQSDDVTFIGLLSACSMQVWWMKACTVMLQWSLTI